MVELILFLVDIAETIWPGVSKLPDFKAQFPRWESQNLATILPPTLSDHGKDLFKVSSYRVFNRVIQFF